MLEILAIIALASSIKKIVIEKGLKPWKYIILMVVLWILFEFTGGIVGVIFFGEGLAAYPGALFGAALGGLLGYIIAKSAKSRIEPKEVLETGAVYDQP
jgi:membrane associated rhomboid family serine protease